jgi:hypothetical protein
MKINNNLIVFDSQLNTERELEETIDENDYFKAHLHVSQFQKDLIVLTFTNDNVKTIRKFLQYETSVFLNKDDVIELVEFLQNKLKEL